MQLRARTVIGGTATALVVIAGCLYPSFDEVEADGSKGKGSSGSSGSSSGTTSSGGTSGGPSSSSSSSGDGSTTSSSSGDGSSDVDGGGDSAPTPKEIICSDDGGVSCPVPAQFCCTTIGGPNCQQSTEGFCTSVEGGEVMRCDGSEDCPANLTCCYVQSLNGSACSPACGAPGKELCNGPAHSCKDGKACSGTVAPNFRACQ